MVAAGRVADRGAAPRGLALPLQLAVLLLLMLLLVMVMPTRGLRPVEQGEEQSKVPQPLSCCGCWNSTEDGAEVLEVECHCTGQHLSSVPANLDHAVQRLTIAESPLISVVRTDAFKPYAQSLRDIVLTELPKLRMIEAGAFGDLPLLRTIVISRAEKLQVLPHGIFNGISGRLNTLRILHTGLLHVPDLSQISGGAIMNMIDLVGNNIRSVQTNALRVKADELLLDYNDIEFVESWAFNGSEIAKLSLKGNRALSKLSLRAFKGIRSLRDLDLSETSITQLPTLGLEELEILRIQNTATLKEIPSVYSFKHLQEALLTYSFHCCAFKFPAQHDPERHSLHQVRRRLAVAYLAKLCAREAAASSTTPPPPSGTELPESLAWLSARLRRDTWLSSQLTTAGLEEEEEAVPWGPHHHHDTYQHETLRGHFDTGVAAATEHSTRNSSAHLRTRSKSEEERPSSPTPVPENDGVFHQTTAMVPTQRLRALCGNLTRSFSHDIRCQPAPDAFNPCEDIMGAPWLRAAAWLVVTPAVLGNLAVIVVLLIAGRRPRMTVPKFLMCNLAFADLCMGTYLLLIAAMDLHSIGVYFNFAHDWQSGVGCKAAGFISIFASQLSVFTLSVLTLERWLAITFAMRLTRRLSLRGAAHTMAVGWAYAITMAALPLCGISGYSKTSICLPMETDDLAAMCYLVFLLVANGLAFLVILGCYVHIYLSLDSGTRVSGEMTVARKMALLVLTDLACWAPIAFFGLTAVFGYPLIDVTRSKILLVFFYPLNSCANPFLYAILTSQYRADLLSLLGRLGLRSKKTVPTSSKHVEGVASNGGRLARSLSAGVPISLAYEQKHEDHRYVSCETLPQQKPSPAASPTTNSAVLKGCIIVQDGANCTVCVIRNQQETFL